MQEVAHGRASLAYGHILSKRAEPDFMAGDMTRHGLIPSPDS